MNAFDKAKKHQITSSVSGIQCPANVIEVWLVGQNIYRTRLLLITIAICAVQS